MLADMESLQKRIAPMEKKARGGDKEAIASLEAARAALAELEAGERALAARPESAAAEKLRAFDMLQLLTAKPVLYACNVDESAASAGNAYSRIVEERAAKEGNACVSISAKIEQDIAVLENESERGEFLESLGLKETGLAKIIRAGYGALDLITFFTAGPKEARAWTVRRGAKAPEAAGVIHTDFQKGFIRAETVSCEDYIKYGGEQGAREAGRLRTEGRDYIVRDGDIFHFLFNT
jgi:GTP-binding protein YchF